jgi:DNA-binding response OmpR family regulator
MEMVPNARRVLLVDDGQAAVPAVVDIAAALELAGFTVRIAGAGDEPPTAVAARFRPDVAVVSVGSDVSSGADELSTVVHSLRSDHGVPVLVVGSDDAVADRAPLAMLQTGATGRARAEPVVSQLASVLHETPQAGSPTLEAGDVVVDEAGRLALRADEPLDLTRLEFDLLAYFVRNRNRVVSREALMSSVWRGVPVTPNAVEAVVSKLRAKLERLGPRLVHTVRGVGYVLRVQGTSPFDLRRHALLAERDRIVRERDEVVARREELRRARLAMGDGSSGDTIVS